MSSDPWVARRLNNPHTGAEVAASGAVARRLLSEQIDLSRRAFTWVARSRRPAPASLAPGEEPKGPYAQFPGPDQIAQAQVRELVMRLYQGFDSGKLDEFGAVVDSTFRASVMGNQTLDWNGFKSFGAQFMRAFPDGKHEFDRIVVSGDTVVTIGHYVGTHQGELMGIAPTHKRLKLAVMHLDRVANGKVVEHVGIANGSDLVRQLRGKE